MRKQDLIEKASEQIIKDGTSLTNGVSAGYQITAVKDASDGSTVESYIYDDGGRVTRITRDGATRNLGYNAADQLTAVTNGMSSVSYAHDAAGRRTISTNFFLSGTVRRFVVAPTPGTDLDSSHLVTDATGAVHQAYVYVGDAPLLRVDAYGNPVYYLEDAMGSIAALADDAGTKIASFDYDGFGNERSSSGTTAAPHGTGGDFRFHGAWLEEETGLYNMRAREYDPRMGRFTSRDPQPGGIELSEALHPYTYVLSNPYIGKDPSGEFSIVELNIVSAMQFNLQTLKTAAVNYARRKATGMLFEAIGSAVEQQIQAFLGFRFARLKSIPFIQNLFTSGQEFDRWGALALCGTVGKIPGMENNIHSGVRIVNKGPRMGDPITNGRNCKAKNLPRTPPLSTVGLSYSVPDFIIGDKPVERFAAINTQYNQAFAVGDFKLSARALYNDYAKRRPRKPDQFNAIVAYAGDHTYLRTALFVVVRNGKNPRYGLTPVEMTMMKSKLGSKAIARGVVPVMVVLFGK